ncbi:MAG: hypothetical protein WCH05_06620 [Chlorobiaceae bacterium]
MITLTLTATELSRRDGRVFRYTVPCPAEILYIDGEQVIVERQPDGGVGHRKHRPVGHWVADCAGSATIKGFGVSAESRDEVIETMRRSIIARKKIQRLRMELYQQKLRREIKTLSEVGRREERSEEGI